MESGMGSEHVGPSSARKAPRFCPLMRTPQRSRDHPTLSRKRGPKGKLDVGRIDRITRKTALTLPRFERRMARHGPGAQVPFSPPKTPSTHAFDDWGAHLKSVQRHPRLRWAGADGFPCAVPLSHPRHCHVDEPTLCITPNWTHARRSEDLNRLSDMATIYDDTNVNLVYHGNWYVLLATWRGRGLRRELMARQMDGQPGEQSDRAVMCRVSSEEVWA